MLRRATPADAEGLWRLQRDLITDGRGMVQLPEEARESPEPCREMLEGFAGRPEDRILLIAIDGRAVATVDVKRIALRQLAHNAYLTIGVHPDVQGRGLGRWLMRAAVDWARQAGVLHLELNVLADNARAVALYRSMGFEVAYRRERFLRRPDGTWLDDLLMVLRFPVG